MIISLNWLKKYTDINMPVDELVTLIGARLVEIEEAIDLGAKYEGVLAVKVVEASKLEDSDHLNITKIDDGGVTTDINRDENGLIQVVCGAPNIASGQVVAWLPPKTIVPSTYYSSEQFILGSRELRGVMSNGMIASAKELDLFDDHEGILVLDSELAPGTKFSTAYELDDYLLDIENKSLTHRPDTFGIIGFAREVAAISGKKFKTPEWLVNPDIDLNNQSLDEVSLKATIDNPSLSDRYLAIVVSDADSKRQSPLKIQTYLARVGVRPINAVVDVTNYLMLLTGQPLHAFDYDKLVAVGGGAADIHVRLGCDGESLELLDGRKIKLSTSDIVIAAGETAIGLAGAMGGANTAIDESTKNIIIESATFNLYNLRSTQMRHGIFSEAITRFTKGQPASLTAPVLLDAVRLMGEWSGSKRVSRVAEAYPEKNDQVTIKLSRGLVNSVLGVDMAETQIISTLENVEFTVEMGDSDEVLVKAPWWRADIHIPEDVIEEVGRLNGFDNIKPTLPMRDFTATSPSDFDEFRSHVRKIMARAGANEVLAYSFIHGDILQKAVQDVSNSYRIVNSISPSLQYYRQTLTPSLLELVHPNIKQGFSNFSLFEINKTHPKKGGLNDEGVPIEAEMMAMVVTSKIDQSGAPYYVAKRIFEYLGESLGLNLVYESIPNDDSDSLIAPFENLRGAKIVDKTDGSLIGIIGEYKKSVVRGFKLPDYSAGFEINVRKLFTMTQNLGSSYKPTSHYPSTERDICFRVSNDVTYAQIINILQQSLKDKKLDSTLEPVDIYQPESRETKNITVRIKLVANDHTLTAEEVNIVISDLSQSVISMTNAVVI